MAKRSEQAPATELGKLTDEQIEGLKKKFFEGPITEIAIWVDEAKTQMAFCYLKFPDRKAIAEAMEIMGQENYSMIKVGQSLLANCWVSGHESIKKNDPVYFGACVQAAELAKEVQIREGESRRL